MKLLVIFFLTLSLALKEHILVLETPDFNLSDTVMKNELTYSV